MEEKKVYFGYRDENGQVQFGMIPGDKVKSLIGEMFTEINKYKRIKNILDEPFNIPTGSDISNGNVAKEKEIKKLLVELNEARAKIIDLKCSVHVLTHRLKNCDFKIKGIAYNYNKIAEENDYYKRLNNAYKALIEDMESNSSLLYKIKKLFCKRAKSNQIIK